MKMPIVFQLRKSATPKMLIKGLLILQSPQPSCAARSIFGGQYAIYSHPTEIIVERRADFPPQHKKLLLALPHPVGICKLR